MPNTYELFPQLEGLTHRTRANRPQSDSIVECLRRTLLDERFRVEGRRTWLEAIDECRPSSMTTCLHTIASDPAKQGGNPPGNQYHHRAGPPINAAMSANYRLCAPIATASRT